jgi:hypothetical protein
MEELRAGRAREPVVLLAISGTVIALLFNRGANAYFAR